MGGGADNLEAQSLMEASMLHKVERIICRRLFFAASECWVELKQKFSRESDKVPVEAAGFLHRESGCRSRLFVQSISGCL